ncbi:MAG: hypothetical protein A4E28_03218 [Methanocella sp. PtaU1.Bin125]|nr:MAG: hypothetical protein A4E28_03218 [Methanocella sp. PtaU1.Bin125]
MSRLSVNEVGERLATAGRMSLQPLCVYWADAVPEGVVKVSDVVKAGHRCLAKATLLVAAGKADGVYVGGDTMKGTCQGSHGFLGLAGFPEDICNDLSTGKDAMYLKESPQCAAWTLTRMGSVKFSGKYLVIQRTEKAGDVEALSYLCIGQAEAVRNLCGLIHFGSDSPFGQIDAAWGSFCASFIAYPSGMARGAPKDTAFIGPTAPDGNPWFPPDMMAIGIPAKVAQRMAGDVERSFVMNCVGTTYPEKRDSEVVKALNNK